MIVIFSNSRRNLAATDALIAEHQQSVFNYHKLSRTIDFDKTKTDDTLILLDLDADGTVQNLLAPEIVARSLYDSKLLNHIKSIKILVSDINPNYPMSVYAWELSKAILELDPILSIPIMHIRQKSRSLLLIEPPTEMDPDWIVYYLPFSKISSIQLPEEIAQTGIPDATKDYFGFFKTAMPGILFKGDLSTLFDTRGTEVQPEMVRNTHSI